MKNTLLAPRTILILFKLACDVLAVLVSSIILSLTFCALQSNDGATCRTPPIPRSALEKDPRPGPLFEGNPVGEAQHDGALPPPCIVRKDPRVPHTARRGA